MLIPIYCKDTQWLVDSYIMRIEAKIFYFLICCLLCFPGTSSGECGKNCGYWRSTDFLENPAYNRDIPFLTCFRKASDLYGVAESLLISVAAGESSFNSLAVSSSNAIGIMQIKWPITAHHLGVNQRDLLFNPCINIKLGAKYLRELLTRYDNSVHHALAAYYFGPSRVSAVEKIPQAARNYSKYIFDHYVNLFSYGRDFERGGKISEVIPPEVLDGAASKRNWISSLNFEKSRLRKQVIRSYSKVKENFKSRHSKLREHS